MSIFIDYRSLLVKIKIVDALRGEIFLFFFLFLSISFAASALNTDVLVFSPHPDDAALCCGGMITKTTEQGKKVKVVFVTNGDAYSRVCAYLAKKKEKELLPADYIRLGEIRQKEALRARRKLGLKRKDIIFLSYPDKGLRPIWEEKYRGSYYSTVTNVTSSPYVNTYNRAKKGYNKKNLLLDIEDILSKYRPRRIYTPYPLDIHPDHNSTTKFVLLALDELRHRKEDSRWLDKVEIFYYCVHKPKGKFSNPPNYKKNITNFKKQKADALKEYTSQIVFDSKFLKSFIKGKEQFWTTAGITPGEYLKQIEEEWGNIGSLMRKDGYNVNFAPVADVAQNINCLNNPLVEKRRIFSEDPDVVTKLVLAEVKGMNRAGIIPVVKHFPGSGMDKIDSHWRLSSVPISKKEIYNNFLPYKQLIKSRLDFWVMTGHTVYPVIDSKPASFSHKITTGILRERLGFKGIIVTDELNVMQAVKEYALSQGRDSFSAGDAAVWAFKAGADFALVYVVPEKTEKTIKDIISKVEEAVKKGELTEKEINNSVERILKEKEKVFHKPLVCYLKEMSLREKIAQKIIIDAYTARQIRIIKKYKIGGVHLRRPSLSREVQNGLKIPIFVIAMYEGGEVEESGLRIATRSAYLTGEEYERLLIKEGRLHYLNGNWSPSDKWEGRLELSKKLRYNSLLCLENTINRLIKIFSQEERTYENPSGISPLSFYPGQIKIKPYCDSPFEWLKKFSYPGMAKYAYSVLREVFIHFPPPSQITAENNPYWKYSLVSYLRAIRTRIEEKNEKNAPSCRALCLAAHPDDEDGLGLLYLKNRFDCKTYILLATRGEGGDDNILPVFGNDLGFLRIEEEERAASILGVNKVYYLGAPDFGFTSSLKKVWKKWDREELLKKLVYFYRLIRPQVIITKHTSRDSHAQHRAFLILAKEAFKLAGSRRAYPEMMKEGLSPYKPFKFYERPPGKEGQFIIDAGKPVYPGGKTYAQLILKALKQHKTQGDWQGTEKFYGSQRTKKVSYELAESNSNYSCSDFICPKEIDKIKSEPGIDKRDTLPSGIMGIKITPGRVGLIENRDNTLFTALEILGYNVSKINEEMLRKGNLLQFDTIIIARDAYHYLSFLPKVNNHLFSFVKYGGKLVVFAQSNEDEAFYAPYPLKIKFIPVEGNSKVSIVYPDNPLFNFPNKIYSSDFNHWIAQRGLFFPSQYSSKYIPLTACEAGGKKVKGGFLTARIGEGLYVITFYDWFRQLRHFNFGAYKILADMAADEK